MMQRYLVDGLAYVAIKRVFMKRERRRLYLAALFASLVALVDTSVFAQSIKGWRLQQDNPHTGIWEVYLTSGGMAAVNEKLNCTLVTRAPQWNVVMYNNKTKVYFMAPLSEWNGMSIKGQSNNFNQTYGRAQSVLVERPPKKIKDGKILGYKASEYLTDNLASTGLKKVEFWITPEIQAPSQLKHMFSKIYGVGLSKMTGLPLEVSYIDENGKRTPVFTTRKVAAAQIRLQSFIFPSSYKRVDSEIAVLMDEKGREAMASIMDDLGEQAPGEDIDSLLGSSKKSTAAYKNPYSSSYSNYKTNGDDGLFDDSSTSKTPAAESKSSGNWFEDLWKAICDWFANFGK